MLIILAKSQSLLFDAPVQVAGHVRKDGVLVAPHTRIQKKVIPRPAAAPAPHTPDLFGEAPAPAAKPSKFDTWVTKHGGEASVARTLASLTEGQQQRLLAEMAKVAGKTVAEVAARFEGRAAEAPRAPEKGETPDLFAQPAAPDKVEVTERVQAAQTAGRKLSPVMQGELTSLNSINRALGRPELSADEYAAQRKDIKAREKVSELRKKAKKLADSAHSSLAGVEPGQPVVSTRDRNKREASGDLMRRAAELEKQADDLEASLAKPAANQPPAPAPADDTKIDTRLQAQANRRHDPTAPFGVQAGISKAERRAINAKVVDLVRDGRKDLDLMRQYSGNGGCGDSLNEFYTDPDVAASMWHVIEQLAGPSGTALEPSCATGVFLHTAPAGYRVTGVEMDPISQACAVALHGDRHEIMPPQSLERFARSDGGRQFKVVIGNPPYGPRGSLAKDDKRNIKSAEAYFIDTSLDKCEPGGIVALVVPASVMNNKNGRAFRQRILCKAEFLGAQRMPNTAFEASHTDVTADIIWLRKRPDDVAGALLTLEKGKLQELGVWDDEFLAGSYFEGRGADNLFGKAGKAMRAFGEIYTVEGSMAGVADRIREFEPHPVGKTPTVNDVVAALAGDDEAVKKAMGGAMVRPYADAKKGDTKTVDGITYVLQGDPLRWHRVDEMLEHDSVADARPLAERIESVLAGQADDGLAADVQAYIARHGVPVKNDKLVAAADLDKKLHRLIGAVDREGRISDAVAGRREQRVMGSVETAAATLAAESEEGTFTVADLAARSGKSKLEVSELLHAGTGYAYAGAGRWTTMDQYLTGDLWAKLDAARSALKEPDLDAGARAKYELQVRRLDEVIAPKSLEDVEITLASGWVPAKAIEAWADSKRDELRQSSPTSEYYAKMANAKVEFSGGLYSVRMPAVNDSIVEKYLNRTGLRQDDKPAIDRWNDEFKAWLLTSPMRDEVEELYNRKFRGFIERPWSRAPIDVPGLDTAGGTRTPNDYHWDSLRWALHTGKGIIADDVGLGKTLRGLMLARLAKMYGKAQKPTFVVPKSVLANWVAEADMWFPGSRILVIGETYTRDKAGNLKSKSDTPAERNRKYHDLTQNDYDFVFVSRDAYNELDVDPITKERYLGEDFWVQRGDKLGNAGDKRIKKVREQFEQAQADREFGKRTDAIHFNDLPIDMLIMDEGHAYKNLYAARARFGEQPKFLGGQGQSNRAFDTGFKTKWLREKNDGKGVYMLTATPTKNSPLEIYSMLSYVAPEEFERLGIRNSEDFLDRFCEFKSDQVLGTNGVIDSALVTSGFKNLDELRPIMAKYIARRTAKDVGLKIPTPEENMHLVDMSPAQQRVYGELREMLAESGKKDATGDAHVFSIMDKMAKAALDLELLDPKAHAGAPSPKYDAAAAEIAKRRADGGQVVFCEAVDSHEKIAQALERAGVPRERIGIMNAQVASSSAARQNLSDKFNRGDIDVVIGNKVMEEGVNLQKRTSDIHHLDTPWDPATLQQRNGRGVRQGNKREAVRIHTYLSRGSFDGYRYQSMRAKRDWQDLLWNGGDRVENLAREGVISRDDLLVAMAADPEAAREKLQNDKAAALERHAAGKRVEASEQFVRFQSLNRSFRGLKNVDTVAGRRLRAQIEKAKTTLASNPYFKAKDALDSNEDALIHPGTGDVVRQNQGIEVDEADGTKTRWVVTGVNALAQTVSMRPYADTTGHKGVKVPLMKLATGTREYAFDKEAEAAEVGKKMEEAAAASLNSIKKYEDVLKMPAAVIEKNHDLLQRQLKEGAKNYSVDFGYGDVPLVERATGKITMHGRHAVAANADTHDVWLPSEQNRETAIKQWIQARVESKIGTRSVQVSGRSKHKQFQEKQARIYAGSKYGSEGRNPHTELLNLGDGIRGGGYGTPSEGPAVKEAKQRLEAQQLQRIRGAKSVREAMEALMPLGAVGEKTVTYPPRALAMAWAKAKQLGGLSEPLEKHIAMGYGQTPLHSPHAYNATGEGWDHAKKTTVHTALMKMAAAGQKTRPLALAISRATGRLDAEGDYTHNQAYKAMVKMAEASGADEETRIAAYQRALAHAEAGRFADSTKQQVHSGWDGYNYGYGYNPVGAGQKVRDYIQEQIDRATRAAAARKEAA